MTSSKFSTSAAVLTVLYRGKDYYAPNAYYNGDSANVHLREILKTMETRFPSPRRIALTSSIPADREMAFGDDVRTYLSNLEPKPETPFAPYRTSLPDLKFIDISDPQHLRGERVNLAGNQAKGDKRMHALLSAITDSLESLGTLLIWAASKVQVERVRASLCSVIKDGPEGTVLTSVGSTRRQGMPAKIALKNVKLFNDPASECRVLITTPHWGRNAAQWERHKPVVIAYETAFFKEGRTYSSMSQWLDVMVRAGREIGTGLCITLLDPGNEKDVALATELVPYLEEKRLGVPNFMRAMVATSHGDPA